MDQKPQEGPAQPSIIVFIVEDMGWQDACPFTWGELPSTTAWVLRSTSPAMLRRGIGVWSSQRPWPI